MIYVTNEALSWAGYSIDGNSNVTVTQNGTLPGLPLKMSNYTLTLYANDTLGNWATPQTAYFFIVPNSGPTQTPTLLPSTSPTQLPMISILSPANDSIINSYFADYPDFKFTLTYETNKVLSWVGYSIDGRSNVTITGNSVIVNETVNDSGYNTLTLYANDTDGNWVTPQTVTYLVVFHSDALSEPPNNTQSNFAPLIIIAVLVVAAVVVGLMVYFRRRK